MNSAQQHFEQHLVQLRSLCAQRGWDLPAFLMTVMGETTIPLADMVEEDQGEARLILSYRSRYIEETLYQSFAKQIQKLEPAAVRGQKNKASLALGKDAASKARIEAARARRERFDARAKALLAEGKTRMAIISDLVFSSDAYSLSTTAKYVNEVAAAWKAESDKK